MASADRCPLFRAIAQWLAAPGPLGTSASRRLPHDLLRAAWTTLASGPKSLVLVTPSSRAHVLKIYRATPERPLRRVTQSYIRSWREHPHLFPAVRIVGRAVVQIGRERCPLLFVWQTRATGRHPRRELDLHQWDRVLARWDDLIRRTHQPLAARLQQQLTRVNRGDHRAYWAVLRRYDDGFASSLAPLGYLWATEQRLVRRAERVSLPAVFISECSQIIGDISPKHVFVTGPYLAFDLEKYGPGDPAKDLSTVLRFYIYRDRADLALRFFWYVQKRYADTLLGLRLYLAALGSGRRLLKKPVDRVALLRYRKVLAFHARISRWL